MPKRPISARLPAGTAKPVGQTTISRFFAKKASQPLQDGPPPLTSIESAPDELTVVKDGRGRDAVAEIAVSLDIRDSPKAFEKPVGGKQPRGDGRSGDGSRRVTPGSTSGWYREETGGGGGGECTRDGINAVDASAPTLCTEAAAAKRLRVVDPDTSRKDERAAKRAAFIESLDGRPRSDATGQPGAIPAPTEGDGSFHETHASEVNKGSEAQRFGDSEALLLPSRIPASEENAGGGTGRMPAAQSDLACPPSASAAHTTAAVHRRETTARSSGSTGSKRVSRTPARTQPSRQAVTAAAKSTAARETAGSAGGAGLGDEDSQQLPIRQRGGAVLPPFPFPPPSAPLTDLEQQVVTLKRAHPDALLVIEVGYKFKFFGPDADVAARLLGIWAHPDRAFRSAFVPLFNLGRHVRRLVTAGYKVGVVRQAETAAQKAVAAGGQKYAPFKRQLTGLYTRATIPAMADIEGGGGGGGEGEIGGIGGRESEGQYLVCLAEEEERRGGMRGEERGGEGGGRAGAWDGEGDDERLTQGGSEGGKGTGMTVGTDTAGSSSRDKRIWRIGLVVVEVSTGEVAWGSFQDGSSRSRLRSYLETFTPSEVVLATATSAETDKVTKCLLHSVKCRSLWCVHPPSPLAGSSP